MHLVSRLYFLLLCVVFSLLAKIVSVFVFIRFYFCWSLSFCYRLILGLAILHFGLRLPLYWNVTATTKHRRVKIDITYNFSPRIIQLRLLVPNFDLSVRSVSKFIYVYVYKHICDSNGIPTLSAYIDIDVFNIHLMLFVVADATFGSEESFDFAFWYYIHTYIGYAMQLYVRKL